MKGIDIVVFGNVGHMSAFMAQAGAWWCCGDAGEALGDSLYEARLFVRGDGQEPGRRLRGKGDAARASRAAGRPAGPRRVRRQSRRSSAATARPASSTISTSTTPRRIEAMTDHPRARTLPIQSATFSNAVNAEIRRAAETGIYDIRGGGAKRKVPHFDDLLFLGASISRYPLEGYREKCCDQRGDAGRPPREKAHRAGHPDHHRGHELRRAVGRGEGGAGARRDDGRHLDHHGRRRHDRGGARAFEAAGLPVPAVALRHEPRRPAPRRRHRGGGGPGRQARRRRHAAGPEDQRPRGRDAHLPKGIDQRSACRHPDWTGPDDLEIKILELREITGWEKPIYVKIGGTRPYFDTALAVKAGADVVVIDGMQGGTAATQDVFIEHVGIPTLACIRPAVQALQDLGVHREVQLIVSGGIRTGADVAKALALGADAVSIGTAAMVASATTTRNGRPSTRRSAPPRAPMTTGTRGATPPASPRRTRRSRRGSTRWRRGASCATT
jgi:hypothetical protein